MISQCFFGDSVAWQAVAVTYYWLVPLLYFKLLLGVPSLQLRLQLAGGVVVIGTFGTVSVHYVAVSAAGTVIFML